MLPLHHDHSYLESKICVADSVETLWKEYRVGALYVDILDNAKSTYELYGDCTEFNTSLPIRCHLPNYPPSWLKVSPPFVRQLNASSF